MPLAGDEEVVVAVQPQLHRRFGFESGQRRPHSHVAGLRLLAAKAAAHAPAFHRDAVAGNAQRMRDPVLHLARVLRAAGDVPLVLLARHGEGDLAFQIKVLLPADGELALQAVRRYGERG